MKISFQILFIFIFLQKRNIRTANGLVNKALHRTTIQSGTLQWPEEDANAKWSSAHAVDGRKDCPASATWRDYSGTMRMHTPWWQVDLGEVIEIGQVVVYGQPRESPPQLKGFRIYITIENITSSEDIAYVNNVDYGNGVFFVNISHTHQAGRYVTVDLPMNTFSQRTVPGPLMLCEIEIFSPECGPGTYGEECSACSTHCFNGVSRCDKVTGACREGCEPGYMRPNCIAQCPDGKYGRNCELDCSTHCFGGFEQCNKETGECTQGCNNGYMGWDCTTQCTAGKYGRNCAFDCNPYCFGGATQCNKEAGECTLGCNNGYMGSQCTTQCPAGKYGRNCELDCSTHCFGGFEQCNKETGECTQGCNNGYMGWNCTTQCPAGKYSRNCELDCSTHCFGGFEQCNKETGECTQGCNNGYMGWNCKTQCEDGTYGQGCSKFCHCADDIACNKETGRCPNGCDIMWGGNRCSEYKGLNFSSHITTTQSDNNDNNYASYAVDKVNNYNVDTCKCCSVAVDTRRRAWWQIDLGTEYLIDALSLFGGSDNNNQWQIQRAEVYAGNQSLSRYPALGSLVYTVPSNIGNQYHFVHLLNSPIIARYFIVRLNQLFLTLCEFHLRNKVCPSGSFGEGCLHKCHCKDGAPCDTVTGYCPNTECDPGWKGNSCNTECADRTFGYGCNYTCHCSSCDPVDGSCDTQCDPGWRGSSCSLVCPFRTFGANCSITCNCFGNSGCNPENGACKSSSCDPGWQGDTCSTACETPSFGFGCNYTCHCINNTPCHHINGRCYQNACESGWKGIACSQECSAGTFGAGCQSKCHCINGSNCHHINGTCERGLCSPGWTGHACDRVENLLIRVHSKIRLEMSSIYNENWTADLAIDNNLGPEPDTCRCCSRTRNSEMSWWRVDLSGLYPLKMVTIIARKQGPGIIDLLGGFSLFLTNDSDTGGIAFYTEENIVPKNVYAIPVNNTLARFLTIKRPGVLEICEVIVIEGECRQGSFGENCSRNCYCAGSDVCSHDYGICPRNCMDGYEGPHCDLMVIGKNSTKESSEKSNISIIIGCSVPASVLVLLTASGVVFTISKRWRNKDDAYTRPNLNMSPQNNSDYDTLEVHNSDYVNTVQVSPI